MRKGYVAMKKIAALFASRRDAYTAVSALFRCGFPLDDIGVAVKEGALAGYVVGEQAVQIQSVQSNAFAAAIGALGGVLGLIAGAAGAMPLFKGPLVALGVFFALAIAAVGIAVGIAAGRLIGQRDGLQLARQAAGEGAVRARSDGFLVTVEADGPHAERALVAIRGTRPLDLSVDSAARTSGQGVELDPAIERLLGGFLDRSDER